MRVITVSSSSTANQIAITGASLRIAFPDGPLDLSVPFLVMSSSVEIQAQASQIKIIYSSSDPESECSAISCRSLSNLSLSALAGGSFSFSASSDGTGLDVDQDQVCESLEIVNGTVTGKGILSGNWDRRLRQVRSTRPSLNHRRCREWNLFQLWHLDWHLYRSWSQYSNRQPHDHRR